MSLDAECDEFDHLIPLSVQPLHSAEFLHEILSNGYIQISTFFNFMGRLLDHVFTNDLSNIELLNPHHPLTNIDAYYPPLLLIFGTESESPNKPTTVARRNFVRGRTSTIQIYWIILSPNPSTEKLRFFTDSS